MNATVLNRETALSPAAAGLARHSKQIGLICAIVLVSIAVISYGYHWFEVGRYTESTDDAYVGGDITVIAPKVSGFISQVAVTDNQTVAAGDLLVKLDDRDYVAALAKAEASAEAQRATLANLDATRSLQMAVIAQARAGVSAANAELTRARSDEARFRDLSAHSAASVQSFQKASAEYQESQATVQRALAALDAAERQLQVIDAQKRQSQAAIAEAVANVDIARLNVGYTELRSPIAGVVGNRSARAGAYASIGTQLISVIPADGLWVDANFKENQIARARPGLRVIVKADVLPGEVFRGHVDSLAPATGAQFSVLPPENATGNFTKIVQRVPVRIVLDGNAARLGRLRPGLSVSAAIDVRDPATLAPDPATLAPDPATPAP
jgi:membrane fusion protein, multidrug efflux system